MPRTKQLVSALALALAGMGSAQAQEFSALISFGDSLSDAGQYAALPPPYYFGAQGSFTTNPDDVWTQVLASSFGLSSVPSIAGGSNYAWGGAPTSFSIPPIPLPLTCIPASLPCRSVQIQIGEHLHGGTVSADSDALYTYWAGANDIFNYLGWAGPQLISAGPPPVFGPPLISSAQAQQFTGASALNAAGQIGALQTAGAEHIVVMNLPDIGKAPNFTNAALFPTQASPAASAAVSGLVFVYNNTLNGALAAHPDGIIAINAYGLVNEVLADPGTYGFSNTTATACNTAALPGKSSLFCTPAAYVSPGANESYLFADGVHPSGAAHRMLAQVVQATIMAPGQVAMAAEVPLAVYDSQSNFLNNQIFGMSRGSRESGESAVYGRIQYSNNDFNADANTHGFESNLAFLSLGADVQWTDMFSVGGSISYGGTRGDGIQSEIDADEVMGSAFGILHAGIGYLDVILSAGSSSFDIDRRIPIGATNRKETGNTSARHFAAELGGGLSFGDENFHHGPFASVTWQQVDVQDYEEDSLDSTSMWFSDFERESTVGRLGYQAEGNAGRLHPFGRVAWAKQNDTDPTFVTAGSNTMNGHFSFYGFTPSEDWAEAELGLGFQIADNTDMSVSYRARLSDDTQDFDALALDFRWEFANAAPAPVVETVVEKTCSELDDDGDGVNNCDDKCPTSAAGEAIGPDGCPVPAAEPEPEPKPFRN